MTSPTPLPARDEITGVILAGGKARRLGGVDKGLMELAGRPLVSWVAEALAPQVGALVVNATRNAERYRTLGRAVIPDRLTERKVGGWYARHRCAVADFGDCRDCFKNINTTEELAALARK